MSYISHKFWIAVILLILSLNIAQAQIPMHLYNRVAGFDYDPKQFAEAKLSMESIKHGIYHFGESEGEWDMVFLESEGKIMVQVWYGDWGKDEKTHQDYWKQLCKTYNQCSLEGSTLTLGKLKGRFANYTEDGKVSRALLLFCDPIAGISLGKDTADVGFYNSFPKGRHYNFQERNQLSLTVQPDDFFKNMTKQELKILRNTVYANYGYQFQKGSEMEQYFSKKSWYHAYCKDVSACLTDIEQRNIQTIIRLEKLAK